MQTILIIEDETRIAHWVREYFEQDGFRALIAVHGLQDVVRLRGMMVWEEI